MGSDEDDRERPVHDLDIRDAYWMGRYPVTVAQFRQYVEESGEKPGDPDSLDGAANEPVVRVSWHEARRFCDWLTDRWQKRGLLPQGWAVRLPSEAEWEKAARGGAEVPREPQARPPEKGGFSDEGLDLALEANECPERVFPWGAGFDEARANTAETGIGRSSAVGCFTAGTSPHGCEEMAGNVWEWTRSLSGDYPYPEEPSKRAAREDLDSENRRVLRGGAFFLEATYARCSAPLGGRPDGRDGGIGFRVSSSPFSSDL
jgi:iron(II)-dependent oxidoreductase